MSFELTKEIVETYMENRKVDNAIKDKYRDIIQKISFDIQELFDLNKIICHIYVIANPDNNFEIRITLNGKIYTHNCKYDILYETAAYNIELVAVKELLYTAKKELAEVVAPTSIWRKFWNWFCSW